MQLGEVDVPQLGALGEVTATAATVGDQHELGAGSTPSGSPPRVVLMGDVADIQQLGTLHRHPPSRPTWGTSSSSAFGEVTATPSRSPTSWVSAPAWRSTAASST